MNQINSNFMKNLLCKIHSHQPTVNLNPPNVYQAWRQVSTSHQINSHLPQGPTTHLSCQPTLKKSTTGQKSHYSLLMSQYQTKNTNGSLQDIGQLHSSSKMGSGQHIMCFISANQPSLLSVKGAVIVQRHMTMFCVAPRAGHNTIVIVLHYS